MEGTIIHKSGLITGGKSARDSGKKWEDKDVKGNHFSFHPEQFTQRLDCAAMQRTKENLLEQLRDLNKTKPRGKADESLIAEISRLESSLTVSKDDLVSRAQLVFLLSAHSSLESLRTAADGLEGGAETCHVRAQEKCPRAQEGTNPLQL